LSQPADARLRGVKSLFIPKTGDDWISVTSTEMREVGVATALLTITSWVGRRHRHRSLYPCGRGRKIIIL